MSDIPFIENLTKIVGRPNIITGSRKTKPYRTGFRSGSGSAQAVVLPGTLLEQWQVLKTCVAFDKIIIMQAANTGLTEGSTPNSDDYDRDIVIINTQRITKILVLGEGEQVIGFSGATLGALEDLLTPLDRSPHSVIGSSCIGASIVGGIANNSGGALVNRGPAYTELALFARINRNGELELVNHLDIDNLGNRAEEILANLESETFAPKDVRFSQRVASDRDYIDRVRDINADDPSRFNADKRRLYEASGCAGKLAVFAVRLDTFPLAKRERTFYIGTNDPGHLSSLRTDILTTFRNLPDIAEYMHRDCFDIAQSYGKDMFILIRLIGKRFLPTLFRLKVSAGAILEGIGWLPKFLVDRILQFVGHFFPQHLPERLLRFRDRYEHHLILKVSDAGIEEALKYLEDSCFGNNDNTCGYFSCTPDEAKRAYLNRFVAAGAAIRYQAIHHKEVGEVLALDVALKRNDRDWSQEPPTEVRDEIAIALYYGHFLCHVFHQDFVLCKSATTHHVKRVMLEALDRRGAKYPAEHNVGHLYDAEEDLAVFYRTLDPMNSFNPGIGKSSKFKYTNMSGDPISRRNSNATH